MIYSKENLKKLPYVKTECVSCQTNHPFPYLRGGLSRREWPTLGGHKTAEASGAAEESSRLEG